jgi:ketosteroid isomerase-like protein
MTTSDQQIVSVTTGEVSKLLDRFAEAQRLSDVDALSRLLTDDFALVGSLGFVVPKQQWLEQFHSGALQIGSLEWAEVDIRTYADAGFAIAIGKLTQAATYAQNRSDGQFRVTLLAIGHGVTWQLAGTHYSPITAPGRPTPEADARDKRPKTN